MWESRVLSRQGVAAAHRLTALMVIALTAAAATAAIATAATAATAPFPATLQIRGRGDGHGVGMPQDGALVLGRAGASARTILSTFYPGTTIEKWRGAHLHIAVFQVLPTTASVVLSLPRVGASSARPVR